MSAPLTAALAPARPCLELRGLKVAHPGRPAVLDGLDLALYAGERLFITGPNGAGKSSLMQTLVGLLPTQAGSLVFDGAPLQSEADFAALRRRVGLVFQDPDDQLFCPTVLDDLMFGPLNLGKTAEQARALSLTVLAQLGLGKLADRVTHALSGGEKRLISLACVLTMQPEVLLLDEPSNALDEDNWQRLVAILAKLPQAMIIVSHDQALQSALATRVLRMQAGRLVPQA
jgi:cobalt/nickel transport system ATP-binding protein